MQLPRHSLPYDFGSYHWYATYRSEQMSEALGRRRKAACQFNSAKTSATALMYSTMYPARLQRLKSHKKTLNQPGFSR